MVSLGLPLKAFCLLSKICPFGRIKKIGNKAQQFKTVHGIQLMFGPSQIKNPDNLEKKKYFEEKFEPPLWPTQLMMT